MYKPVVIDAHFDNDYENSRHILVVDLSDGTRERIEGDGCLHSTTLDAAVKLWEESQKI